LEDLRREYERIKAFISRLEEEHAKGGLRRKFIGSSWRNTRRG
jgi:hypothetical protein